MTATALSCLVFQFAFCAAVVAQLSHANASVEPADARWSAGITAGLMLAGLGFLILAKGA